MDHWERVFETLARHFFDAAGLDWDEVDEETRRGAITDMERLVVATKGLSAKIAKACLDQVERPDKAEHEARMSELLAPIINTHWAFKPRHNELNRMLLE